MLRYALMASIAMATPVLAGGNEHKPPQSTEQLNVRSLATARASSAALSAAAAVAGGGSASAVAGAATLTNNVGGATLSNSIGGATLNGGGASVHFQGSAPAVVLPSIGGGGGDCPVVGFGIGGSGIGGGGGFGPSWISSDCNRRKTAELLASLGMRDAAIQLLRNDPEVAKVLGQ